MKTHTLLMAAILTVGGTVSVQAQPAPVDPASPPTIVPPREVDTPPAPPTSVPGDPIAPETPGTWGPMSTVPTPTPTAAPGPSARRAMSPVGAAVLVGGGFEDFTNSNLKGMTSGGGAWNARAIAGMRTFVGIEAAYTGAARSINTLGLNNNSNLVSNGLEGALRLNIPVIRGRSMVEPFGFVGLGWQHYNLTNNSNNTSDLANNDDVMSLPVGAGLAYSYGQFLADARFTYRETYYNDLLRTSGGKLNNWGVGGQLGVAF
jgi:hypothetical protein